jgi:hypothetical protein
VYSRGVEELVQELGEDYQLLRTLLLTLPIPMRLIKRQADAPFEAIRALSRAWELMEWEERLSKTLRHHLRSMITDWLTAYELAVSAQKNGPAPWRIRGMEAALARFRVGANYAATHRIRRDRKKK